MKIKVRRVEVITPPITTRASGFCTSAPRPVAKAMGKVGDLTFKFIGLIIYPYILTAQQDLARNILMTHVFRLIILINYE